MVVYIDRAASFLIAIPLATGSNRVKVFQSQPLLSQTVPVDNKVNGHGRSDNDISSALVFYSFVVVYDLAAHIMDTDCVSLRSFQIAVCDKFRDLV